MQESAGMMEIRWKIKGKYEKEKNQKEADIIQRSGATDMTRLGGKT